MTWPAARRLSSGALSPGAVARRPTHHTTLAVRRPLLVVRCSSLVARITLRVTRRSLFVARCSLSVGPSLAPECTQSLLVASSLWGLTARRYAAAPSGSTILGEVCRGQHHRLVRHARGNPRLAPRRAPLRGPSFTGPSHRRRRSSLVQGKSTPVARGSSRVASPQIVEAARRASPRRSVFAEAPRCVVARRHTVGCGSCASPRRHAVLCLRKPRLARRLAAWCLRSPTVRRRASPRRSVFAEHAGIVATTRHSPLTTRHFVVH